MLKLRVPHLLLKISLRASSPIWASEASLARTRERGAEESRAPRKPRDSAKRLPLAASSRARAFSRDLFHSPKQESLLAGYLKIRRTLTS